MATIKIKTTNVNFGDRRIVSIGKARTAHGVTIPVKGTLPYSFRSILISDSEAGVQYKHPGIVIRETRAKYGLSAARLAALCNTHGEAIGIKITSADIYNYEAGKCVPKMDKYAILAAAMKQLGVSEHELCGYTTVVERKETVA